MKPEVLQIHPYARLLTMLGDRLIKNQRIALVQSFRNGGIWHISFDNLPYTTTSATQSGSRARAASATSEKSAGAASATSLGCGMTMPIFTRQAHPEGDRFRSGAIRRTARLPGAGSPERVADRPLCPR